ncbi:hypothetical protein Pelo_8045 [Pelomyxa schiedti]|nr:hypothetical protein Pelo_8045 [Pelomyxa schiedti]
MTKTLGALKASKLLFTGELDHLKTTYIKENESQKIRITQLERDLDEMKNQLIASKMSDVDTQCKNEENKRKIHQIDKELQVARLEVTKRDEEIKRLNAILSHNNPASLLKATNDSLRLIADKTESEKKDITSRLEAQTARTAAAEKRASNADATICQLNILLADRDAEIKELRILLDHAKRTAELASAKPEPPPATTNPTSIPSEEKPTLATPTKLPTSTHTATANLSKSASASSLPPATSTPLAPTTNPTISNASLRKSVDYTRGSSSSSSSSSVVPTTTSSTADQDDTVTAKSKRLSFRKPNKKNP